MGLLLSRSSQESGKDEPLLPEIKYSHPPNPPFRIFHIGGCRNYGPFLGTVNIRCRIKIGIPKGAIILTTTHTGVPEMRGPRFGLPMSQILDFLCMESPCQGQYTIGGIVTVRWGVSDTRGS